MMALALAVVTLDARARDRDRRGSASGSSRSTTTRMPRKSMGVPTYRYKLVRVRHFVRARRRGRRHPGAVRVVRHGEQHVQHHRSADRRADERARRHAALGRTRAGRGGDHAAALRVDGRRPGGHRQGGRPVRFSSPPCCSCPKAFSAVVRRHANSRCSAQRRRSLHAHPTVERARSTRRSERALRRPLPTGAPRRSSRFAACASRSGACARSTASISTCATAKSSACSGRTAPASRR